MTVVNSRDSGLVTDPFARFIVAARWDDVPQEVRHEAKRSLLNFFAVALAACNDPTIDIAVQTYKRFSGSANATVIGRSDRLDILNAAALNAMSANVFDFDDTHIPTIIHPTAPVAPAIFSLAETSPTPGSDFLLAFLLGVELECRLGNAISPGHYARGWHITSTCGVFGAAAAVGKLLGLDAQRLAWALGTASAQASGLVETLGTMSKSVSVGNAARNGLLSALLAEQGFDGPTQPLEGARGFLHVFGNQPDLPNTVADLGTRWEIMRNTYKPYPCGVVLNPVIEACLQLAGKSDLTLAKIEQIELVGHPLLRQRTDRPNVATGRESQVSAQHAVGVALTRGKAGLQEFNDEAVQDAAVRSLGSKVRFRDDNDFSVDSARVVLHLKDAPEISLTIDAASGSVDRPLTDSQLEKKLRELCRYGRSGCEAQPLIDAIWAIEQTEDVSALLKLASVR